MDSNEAVRVCLIHLGCARNQIDSEVILGRLAEGGVLICGDVQDAEVAILNTCSFLGAAREESEARIEELLERKRTGQLKGVIVAGCLPELMFERVRQRYSEVDAFLRISDYSEVPRIVRGIAGGREDQRNAVSGAPKGTESDLVRVLASPPSYAYLRISEGCDHSCSFCLIPTIRGAMRSKPIEVLLREAANLAAMGVRELVVVAEDATGYGRDLGRRHLLPQAIEKLADVEGIEWVRVMYAYPNDFPWDLTRLLAEHPCVVPYLDIPVQHIATPVLRAMRRSGSGDQVRRVLDRLRESVPGIALRTTLIVGFPGEGELEFAELRGFVEEFAFDRLGVFAYSPEPGTAARGLEGAVAPEVAQRRMEEIQRLQAGIISSWNHAAIGERMRVLVDEIQGDRFVARTYRDAPEVDCCASGSSAPGLHEGDFVEVREGDFAEVIVAGLSPDGYDLRVELV